MLEIKDLSFSYGGAKPLFTDLSLSIPKGEVLTLLGASGSGKSSLSRLIAGFEKPNKGVISIDSKIVSKFLRKETVVDLPPKERSVAVVFQDFGLFPFLSVEENIKLWSEGEPSSDLIKSLDIEGLLLRKVNTLSGGQKQRVGLSRAIAAKPKLLILDEPLSQLDELAKYKFLDYFKEISASLTCLWITHNPLIALKVSHKICYLGSQKLYGPIEPKIEELSALHPDLATLTKYL